MTNNEHNGSRAPQQVVELFVIAGRETATIEQLTGCVQQLREVQAAKEQLATLTLAEMRAVLAFRGTPLEEAQ